MQHHRGDSETKEQRLDILDKADAVVRALEGGELTAGEISETTGEPISSTYRLISNMLAIDWIMPGTSRGRYRLGLQMLASGTAFIDSADICELLKPSLIELRDTTMLTVYLCVPAGNHAVCVERLPGHGVRSLDLVLGGRLPLTVGGAPTAILATLPSDDASAVMKTLEAKDAEKRSATKNIEYYAANGFTVSDGDVTRGVAAIGVPVFDHSGNAVAAISIGGLRDDVVDNPDLTAKLVRIGHLGSQLLGWEEPNGQE